MATPLPGDARNEPTPSHRGRRDRLYGRRKGRKLRAGQQARVDRLLPQLAIELPAEGARLDPVALFRSPVDAIWLEIGFGGGEHLAAQAAGHPTVGLIGCEVFETGIATLLREVETRRLGNVRLWPEDARRLLAHLSEASLARVFLLFPDPWPKARHARRRFVCPETLAALARAMQDGAELRIASDDEGYIAWSLMQLSRHPDFAWTARSKRDWQTRPAGAADLWPETRYEAKALAAGRKPAYLRYRRRPTLS